MNLTDFMAAIQPAIELIFISLAGLIAYQITAFKNSKVSKDQQEIAANIVDASVKWVEQTTGMDLEILGKEKLEKAKARALEMLAERGVSISPVYLETLIEAAVNGMHNANNETLKIENKED